MYPLDDALIGPASLVTALEAGAQPSEPIRQQQWKAVDTTTTVAALDRILKKNIHLLLTAQKTCREEATY